MTKSAIPGASDEDVTFRRACMTKPLLRPYMPALQSIRGLACLAVLFFHGLWWYIPATAPGLEGWLRTWTAGGFRGVNLFFVLSGLLITGLLLDSRERPDYFQRFYKRRALRILPAYYMMLILLALYGVPRSFLGISLLHAANVAPLLGIPTYGVLWSLGVEEQFYLLWPLVVRRVKTRVLVLLVMGLFLNSITLPVWHGAHGLALGALLAIFLRTERGTRQNVWMTGATFAIAGSLLLWVSGESWRNPQLHEVSGGVGWDFLFGALLVFALLVGSSRYEAWTRPKCLQFFGDISYGLYLVHMLVFMVYRRILHPGNDLAAILMEFLVCSALAVGLATVSRFTVEEWFLRLKDKPLKVSRKRVSSEEFEELTPVCEVE